MTILQGRQRRGSKVVSEEHQVYTLGGAQRKWRMIECKHPHLTPPPPCIITKGICINGVLYYYAWIKNEASLISFDLISEDFNAIKLPEDLTCVVNYTGKVAITSWPTRHGEILQQFGELVNHAGKINHIATQRCTGPVNLWVLEDVNKEV
ncbi:hypothetical protein Bca101_066953 [Brassica carinata]